eukprot:6333372-Pyramimonas_sp.AAC.2
MVDTAAKYGVHAEVSHLHNDIYTTVVFYWQQRTSTSKAHRIRKIAEQPTRYGRADILSPLP